MSAYFTTHHFHPPRLDPAHQDNLQQHPPHPPPITTTITAPSIAGPSSSSATASPSSHRHLSLDTLAHLLHDFHLQQGKSDGASVTHRDVARPHFDLSENKTSYAIYGELAGLNRQDVNVEVNDHLFTITISGQLKRLTPPARPELAALPDHVGVVHRDSAGGGDSVDVGEVTGSGEEGDKEEQKDVHWHVTERKVGEFRREFQFPIETVDMDAVRASMRNGLLCVTVPKKISEKKLAEARRVEVV